MVLDFCLPSRFRQDCYVKVIKFGLDGADTRMSHDLLFDLRFAAFLPSDCWSRVLFCPPSPSAAGMSSQTAGEAMFHFDLVNGSNGAQGTAGAPWLCEPSYAQLQRDWNSV
jgi:hypothetical protein